MVGGIVPASRGNQVRGRVKVGTASYRTIGRRQGAALLDADFDQRAAEFIPAVRPA